MSGSLSPSLGFLITCVCGLREGPEHGIGSARQSRTPTIARWNASVTELCWGFYRDNMGIRGYIEVIRLYALYQDYLGILWDYLGRPKLCNLCMVLSKNPILMANVTAFKGRTF